MIENAVKKLLDGIRVGEFEIHAEEHLEDLMRGKPDYTDVPAHVIFNQVEIYYKPRVL